MRPLPPKLVDQGYMASWLNWLRDCVADRTPQRNPSSRLLARHGGFSRIPSANEEPGSSADPSNWFQGEYDPTRSYKTGQGVVVRGGVSAGTYMAVNDIPVGLVPSFPDLGVNWVSISRGAAGVWG